METYDPHKSTPEVRQGSRRMMNFRVLLWSLLGIVAAFVLIYVAFVLMAPGPETVA